jgi:hypothetical protein
MFSPLCRNKPFPVKAKIEYYQNVLTVLFHNGMSNNDKVRTTVRANTGTFV